MSSSPSPSSSSGGGHGNDDDVYQRFQCHGVLWKDAHLRLLFADSGSILLGFSRLFAFFLLFGLNWYNRRLLRTKVQDNMNVVPGLVLPYYFTYVYLYIGFSLLAGIIDMSLQSCQQDIGNINNWLLPIEQGIFHWLYEGLAFFLMRYGAGVKAFKRALIYSGIWGLFTTVIFFIMFSLYRNSFGFHETSDHTVFTVYLTYSAVLLAFYLSFLVVPSTMLYRRSAMDFYAKFNVIFYIFSIIICSLLYNDVTNVVCAGSVIIFLLVAIIQPLVLFRCLQIDSQYWQGLKPEKGNPLADVWDHVDLATAQSMAENLEKVNNYKTPLPVLHYGLLDFNANEHFVAGGFSRVYFGKLRNEPVAFKILFAMELTPDDVRDFYEEACLLYSLAHDNVVQCKGICVMPPALTMVLEHCMYGSLYDFLHKPLKDAPRQSSIGMLAQSAFYRDEGSTIDMQANQLDRGDKIELISNPIQSQRSTLVSQATSADASISSKDHYVPLDISRVKSNPRNSVNMTDVEVGRSSDTSSRFSRGSRMSEDPDRKSWSGGVRMSRVFRAYESVANIVNSSLGRTEPAKHLALTAAHLVPFETRLRMMKDCANAIAFLHLRGYMHCDIKSLNFLVDANYRVKIADMGEVRQINSSKQYALPPIPARNWAPPEVMAPIIKPDCYTTKSEVYGLCIVLCEVATIELPFGETPERLTGKQWYDKLVVDNFRPTLPMNLNNHIKLVVEQGMRTDPASRPDAVDVLRTIDEVIQGKI